MNKKGAISGTFLIIAAVILVVVWTQTTVIQDLLNMGVEPDKEVPGKCPSSGLTEITINTQEALASTATNSVHDYYVFDKDGVLVTNGNSGGDGQSTFDIKCGINKEYDVVVLNDSANSGFYAQEFVVDASESTFTKNLQTYEYGQMDISNIGSDADPAGTANVSSGIGKTCSFTITYTVNESASAYNKPLILCEANSTSVQDVTMSGVSEADSKKPTRKSVATSGNEWFVFEQDEMIKSTDAAQKVSGKILFSSSVTPDSTSNMTCEIVDQATYKKAAYKTLSLNEGFVEAAEDDSNSDVGAPDSDRVAIHFVHASGYC